MAQTLPELFTSMRVRPVGDYPNRLLQALRAERARGRRRPDRRRAHARRLQLRVLRAHAARPADGRRARRGPRPVLLGRPRVDAHDRRADAASTSSTAGSTTSSSTRSSSAPTRCSARPGSCSPRASAHVTIANAVGNGVADDKLVYTYVPDLIRYYLGEEPILAERRHLAARGAGRARGGARPARRARREARRRLGRQGPRRRAGCLARRARRSCARGCVADPRGWIAQPVVQLSTIPTLVEDGMRPRHADLRPFAVNDGNDVWVLPGGLTRVALPEGQLVVNSSQGGGSKDTWVLGGGLITGPIAAPVAARADARVGTSSPIRPPRRSPAPRAVADVERPQRARGTAHARRRTRTRRSGSSSSNSSSSSDAAASAARRRCRHAC